MANEPAPLSLSDLEPAFAPIGRSRMLPRKAYADPAVTAWERRHFFDGGWVSAGRASDLGIADNAQAAITVGGKGILLTRDADGTLKAFENICRHRGHELLAPGTTSSKRLVTCPYHAWSYKLDGSLRVAPTIGEEALKCAGNLDLIPVGAAEWGGWVFINASGTRYDFPDVLGELAAHAADWECERLMPAATHSYTIKANWKVIVENYLECYHCPSIHPALCRVTDYRSGEGLRPKRGLYAGGWMELGEDSETMSADGRSRGLPFSKLSDVRRRQVHYVALFPNLLISLHPDYVMTHRLEPLSVGETAVECCWLFSPESLAEPGFDPSYAVDFWDMTNREDWKAVESVQRGLASERFVPGLLADLEYTVYDWVHLVASGYLGKPRAPGTIAA